MNLTLNNFPDGLTASYHVPPPPLLYNTPRHFLLFVSFISFTLLIYHLSTARANFLFSRSLVDSSSFLWKKGNKKKNIGKENLPVLSVCPSFKSSRNGVTSILLFTVSQWQLLTIWKEREREITIPFFSFFWKDQSNPLALTNAPTAISSFPIEDFNLFFLSPCPKKRYSSKSNQSSTDSREVGDRFSGAL